MWDQQDSYIPFSQWKRMVFLRWIENTFHRQSNRRSWCCTSCLKREKSWRSMRRRTPTWTLNMKICKVVFGIVDIEFAIDASRCEISILGREGQGLYSIHSIVHWTQRSNSMFSPSFRSKSKSKFFTCTRSSTLTELDRSRSVHSHIPQQFVLRRPRTPTSESTAKAWNDYPEWCRNEREPFDRHSRTYWRRRWERQDTRRTFYRSEWSSPPVAKRFFCGWQARAWRASSWWPWTRSSGIGLSFKANP